MSTTFAVTYNGYSGGRYSLTMNEKSDYNGDGYNGNSLLYIPTKEELAVMNFVDNVNSKTKAVIMTADQSRQAYENWIENDSYAKNHRGQYAKRNSQLTPWEHEVNLHLAQTIYNGKGLGKFQITFDIMNFANMLNKKWGAKYDNAYNLSPLTFAGFKNNQTTFYYNSNNTPTAANISSRWHAQIGFRLIF